jgi:hypothetical protein
VSLPCGILDATFEVWLVCDGDVPQGEASEELIGQHADLRYAQAFGWVRVPSGPSLMFGWVRVPSGPSLMFGKVPVEGWIVAMLSHLHDRANLSMFHLRGCKAAWRGSRRMSRNSTKIRL